MENINWSQILTAIVAIYGAILSTIIFTSRRREKQRRLKVNFSNGFLTYAHDLSEAMLFITISNPGNRDVTINVPSISLPDGKPLVFPTLNPMLAFHINLKKVQNVRYGLK